MPTQLPTVMIHGDWRAKGQPVPSSTVSDLDDDPLECLVDFIPYVPTGFVVYVDDYDLGGSVHRDTAIVIQRVQARIWNGRLCSINKVDSVGVQLVSNAPALNLQAQGIPEGKLIYNVVFSKGNLDGQDYNPRPFAFEAKPGVSTITLTDPALERLPFALWVER